MVKVMAETDICDVCEPVFFQVIEVEQKWNLMASRALKTSRWLAILPPTIHCRFAPYSLKFMKNKIVKKEAKAPK